MRKLKFYCLALLLMSGAFSRPAAAQAVYTAPAQASGVTDAQKYGLSPAASGAANLAALNGALLANQNVSITKPGTYSVGGTVKLQSGNRLECAAGVVIQQASGTNTYLVQNAHPSLIATVTATISGGSVTGLTLVNGGGGYLTAPTIAIRSGTGTGATATCTISGGVITAVTLTSGGSGYLTAPLVCVNGGGDVGIEIKGGTWDANVAGNSASHSAYPSWDGSLLLFVDCSNIVLRDMTILNANQYALQFAGITDIRTERITLATQKDGLHFTGPITRATVRDIKGTTGDDMVAFTASDWPGLFAAQQGGDISDVTVDGVCGVGAWQAVKLSGMAGTKLRRISVNNVSGSFLEYGVIAANDPLDPSTAYTDISNYSVKGVHCTLQDGYAAVTLAASICDSAVFDDINPIAAGAGYTVNGIETAGVINHLTASNFAEATGTKGSLLNVRSGATIGSAVLSNFSIDGAGVNQRVVNNQGTLNRLLISNATFDNSGADMVLNTGTLGQLKLSNVYAAGSSSFFSSNVGATTVDFSTVTADNLANGLALLAGPASLTLTGSLTRIGGGTGTIYRYGTQAVRVNSPGIPCNLAILTPVTGDYCNNSNYNLGIGVGVAAFNGTIWKNLATGSTYTPGGS